MQITVNGKNEEVIEDVTLLNFLKSKDIHPDKVVVEYNNEIVKREEWGNIGLKENDKLEVLRFMGGG